MAERVRDRLELPTPVQAEIVSVGPLRGCGRPFEGREAPPEDGGRDEVSRENDRMAGAGLRVLAGL